MADSTDQLRAWLIERVAYYAERSADDVDPSVPLSSYGLDSVYALTLCGDIEDHLSLRIEPAAAWDFRTIDALLGYLVKELAQAKAVS